MFVDDMRVIHTLNLHLFGIIACVNLSAIGFAALRDFASVYIFRCQVYIEIAFGFYVVNYLFEALKKIHCHGLCSSLFRV